MSCSTRLRLLPPYRHLKTPMGQLVSDPREQADLFARAFEKKCKLPEATKPIVFETPIAEPSDFVLVRTRWVLKFLKAIDVDKATGLDLLLDVY